MLLRLVLLCAVACTACVTTATYDRKVAELEALRTQRERDAELKRKDLESQLAAVQQELKTAEGANAQLTTDRAGLHKQLDDQTALLGELKKRLEKLGQNVDRLTSEKGQLSQVLEDSRSRLEELRRQREVAEARLATFKQLVAKFQSMIDAGQLKVIVRNGRMLISLPDAVLFDSGRTDIKPGGLVALTKVAEVLGAIPDRSFVVAGHTDDVPIHTARFPSNWDLSTARAVEVVNYLVSKGMKPQALSAAGYSEYDPVEANDSAEHKALNRRIEIVLQPNIAELPSLDGLVSK